MSPPAPLPTGAQLIADPWAFGPWCWVIGEVRLLSAPIVCRGMQGLWPLSGTLDEAQIKAIVALTDGQGARGALTLLQPYATAIAGWRTGPGPKRIENRPWRRLFPAEGSWVGLHAGRAPYESEELARDLVALWQRTDEQDRDPRLQSHPRWPGCPPFDHMPRGVLLGAMFVRGMVRYPDAAPGQLSLVR